MSNRIFSRSKSRILLSSDNQHLISPLRNALIKAGFLVKLAKDYAQMEVVWQQSRHEIVLLEVSHRDSIESATGSALRIKRQDAGQFIAYLADTSLQMSGLTGDAIFSRDITRLLLELRDALDEES